MSDHLILIDGSNLFNRAWYTMRGPTLEQLPKKVRGMIDSALRRWGPAKVIIALDSPDCFRATAIPGYKAGRSDRGGPSTSEMTEALRPSFAEWGIPVSEAPRLEADDVIATLVKRSVGRPTSILSRDTDLLQLVSDERRVRVLWPAGKGGGEEPMDEAGIAEYLAGHRDFGVAFPPERLLDLRVMAGGKDNLPRIEWTEEERWQKKTPYGFTTKRAAELMAAGVTLEAVWKGMHVELLKAREREWLARRRVEAIARMHALRLRDDAELVGATLLPSPVPIAGGELPEPADRDGPRSPLLYVDRRALRDLLTREASEIPTRRAWRTLEDGSLVAVLLDAGPRPVIRIARRHETDGWEDELRLIARQLGCEAWTLERETTAAGAVALRLSSPEQPEMVDCRRGCGNRAPARKPGLSGVCSQCAEASRKRMVEQPHGKFRAE